MESEAASATERAPPAMAIDMPTSPDEIKHALPVDVVSKEVESGYIIGGHAYIFPAWIKYLITMVFGTVLLLSPAALIYLKYPSEEYWQLQPPLAHLSAPLAHLFRASLILAFGYFAYFGTISLMTFVPFVIYLVEMVSNGSWGDSVKISIKHFLALKSHFARAFATAAVSVAVSMLFGEADAPDDDDDIFMLLRKPSFTATRASLALAIFAFAILVEKLLIQRIAIYYHSQFYADRIAENNLGLAGLQTLRKRFPPKRKAIKRSGHRQHHPRGDASPMSTSAASMQSLSSESILSDKHEQGDMVADAVFAGLSEGRDVIRVDDFYKVFPEADAKAFFKLVDRDENGDLTLRELEDSICRIYDERDLLVHALAGNSDVIKRLDGLLLVGALAVSVLLWLPLFKVSAFKTLTAFGTFALGFKFIFEGAASTAFTSIIFVLVTHPFDVGDIVTIENQPHSVKSIGLWTSTFLREGEKLAYIANAVLSGQAIGNLRRSPNQNESFLIRIAATTTKMQLDQFIEAMRSYVAEQPRDFDPEVTLKKVILEDTATMFIEIGVGYRSNFYDIRLRHERARKFMLAAKENLEKHEISLGPYNWDPHRH